MQEVNQVNKKVSTKSVKLFIPFLEVWKDMNPASTVDWKVDWDNNIEHMFICPHYTEHVLQHFHPIISVDAAHLKSCYKGTTTYIYMCLTGNDEAYILAFGIRRGNEYFDSWDVFNTVFTQACPCV